MTAPIGGLRDRLVEDAVYNTVKAALTALGWFEPGRKHQPLHMIPERVDEHDQVLPNTLTVVSEQSDGADAELGTLVADQTRTWFVDFYAESEAVGKHVAGDIRDILRGKHPAAGRTLPVVDVYDDGQATPVYLFSVEILDVVDDHAHNYSRPHMRHWYTVRFDTLDSY